MKIQKDKMEIIKVVRKQVIIVNTVDHISNLDSSSGKRFYPAKNSTLTVIHFWLDNHLFPTTTYTHYSIFPFLYN